MFSLFCDKVLINKGYKNPKDVPNYINRIIHVQLILVIVNYNLFLLPVRAKLACGFKEVCSHGLEALSPMTPEVKKM